MAYRKWRNIHSGKSTKFGKNTESLWHLATVYIISPLCPHNLVLYKPPAPRVGLQFHRRRSKMLAFLIPPEPRSISSIPGRHRGENHVFFLWPAPSHKAEALPPGPVCQEYWDPDCPYLSSLIGRRHHIKNSPEDQGLPICPPTCLLTEWECSNNRGPHPYLQYSDTLRQAMELFPHGLLPLRVEAPLYQRSTQTCRNKNTEI